MEGFIDREHTDGVILSDGQYYKAAIQPDVVPLQPQDFPSAHAGSQGDHDDVSERVRWGRAAGQKPVNFFQG